MMQLSKTTQSPVRWGLVSDAIGASALVILLLAGLALPGLL